MQGFLALSFQEIWRAMYVRSNSNCSQSVKPPPSSWLSHVKMKTAALADAVISVNNVATCHLVYFFYAGCMVSVPLRWWKGTTRLRCILDPRIVLEINLGLWHRVPRCLCQLTVYAPASQVSDDWLYAVSDISVRHERLCSPKTRMWRVVGDI